ncbi:MAG: hypothetical protein HOE11_01900 [Candidatus Diapherotrites archaeon]|jgi:intein-encoded DNA endonuclease-like protein|nr:hypothetical protein [Candidatus Diapherotrites archaeon]MBT4597243.1 hypothetical protein [Candidatus Diapherotrites archaeon]
MKRIFHINDFCKDHGYFHVTLKRGFLKELLIKTAHDTIPHQNVKLITYLKMKPTKNQKACLTIYGWTSGKRSIPLEKLNKIISLSNYSWQKLEKQIISIKAKTGKGTITPHFPIKLDEKIGSIIGHILGDGSIDKKYFQLSFSNSNQDLLNEFKTNMQDIFGISPRIWMQKKPNYNNTEWDKRLKNINDLKAGRNCSLFYPTICGLILNAMFNNFAIGKNKRIQKDIFDTPKKFKIGLIRAFYDDEGSVYKSSRQIRLFQDNQKILETFRKLLEELDITTSEVHTYLKHNKKRHYFNIYRKTNFIKFQKQISFTSKRKAQLLNDLITTKNHQNSK